VAITNLEAQLPPPPMFLMARGDSIVSDGESDSDDELDPNEFTNLINEYTQVIKREKSKVKRIENANATLDVTLIFSNFKFEANLVITFAN